MPSRSLAMAFPVAEACSNPRSLFSSSAPRTRWLAPKAANTSTGRQRLEPGGRVRTVPEDF